MIHVRNSSFRKALAEHEARQNTWNPVLLGHDLYRKAQAYVLNTRNRFANARHNAQPKHTETPEPPFWKLLFLFTALAVAIWYQQSNDPSYQEFLRLSEAVGKCDNQLSAFCVDGTLFESREWESVYATAGTTRKNHLIRTGECGKQFDNLEKRCSDCYGHLRDLESSEAYKKYVGDHSVYIVLLALVCCQQLIGTARRINWLWAVFVTLVFIYILVFYFMGRWINNHFNYLGQAMVRAATTKCIQTFGHVLCPAVRDYFSHPSATLYTRRFVLRDADVIHTLQDGTSCLVEQLTASHEIQLGFVDNLSGLAETTEQVVPTAIQFKTNKYGRILREFYGNLISTDVTIVHKLRESVIFAALCVVEWKVASTGFAIRGIPLPGVLDLALGVGALVGAPVIWSTAFGESLSGNDLHVMAEGAANVPEYVIRGTVEIAFGVVEVIGGAAVDVASVTGGTASDAMTGVISVVEGVGCAVVYVVWSSVLFLTDVTE